MKEKNQENGFAVLLSGVSLFLSVICLVAVCHYCYPGLGQRTRQILGGSEDSLVRQAFQVMADGLEAGDPVKETLTETVQVLIGKEN